MANDVQDEWLAIDGVDAQTSKFPVTAEVDGERIVIFRGADSFHAVQRRCPHQSADLSKKGHAIKLSNQSVIRCTLHGIVYRLADGKSVNFPGLCAKIYEVALDGNQLRVRKTPIAGG